MGLFSRTTSAVIVNSPTETADVPVFFRQPKSPAEGRANAIDRHRRSVEKFQRMVIEAERAAATEQGEIEARLAEVMLQYELDCAFLQSQLADARHRLVTDTSDLRAMIRSSEAALGALMSGAEDEVAQHAPRRHVVWP